MMKDMLWGRMILGCRFWWWVVELGVLVVVAVAEDQMVEMEVIMVGLGLLKEIFLGVITPMLITRR
jgi:hypothetical protein